MNKNVLSLIIAGAVALSALSGCKARQGADVETPRNTVSAAENETNVSENENNGEENTGAEQGNTSSEKITAETIASAIKAAYGENYLPNTAMTSEMTETKFGLKPDSYTEIFAESPMIGAHPDTLVIVKAAEGRLEEVKGKLEEYREQLVNDTMQYPMNLAKIHASRVVVNGDFAAFILLGAINGNEDASEEEQAQFAEEQEKIGVDAFNAVFNRFCKD